MQRTKIVRLCIMTKLFLLLSLSLLGQGSPWLSDSVYYFVDAENHYHEPIIADSLFQEVGEKELNFADLDQNVWLKIHTQTSQDQPHYLLINYPLIDSLSLWYFQNGQLIKHFETGSHFPFESRPISDNLFRFPLPSSPTIIYLKARSKLNLQLPLELISERDVDAKLAKADFLQAIYIGLMLLAILGSFIIGSINKKSMVFFAYIGHLIGTAFITLHIGGYAYQYFWPDYPALNIYEPWIFGLGIFSTLFSMEFLNTKEQAPKIHRILWISLICNFSVYPLLLFGQISLANQVVQMVGLLGCALMLVAGIILYRKGYRPARFFILAWSLFLIGVIVTILERLSIIPLSEFTLHASQIGSALDVIFLFAALADRVNLLQQERDEAKEAVLISLRENKAIIEAQNAELEARVNEKTYELKEKNQVLARINHQQSEVLSVIGHDLKGPVASLGQALDLMRNDPNLISPEFLDMLQSSTTNTFNLLENLLSWAQSSTDSHQPLIRKIDIKALSQNIIALYQPSLHQKNIKLLFSIEDNCFAFADERMVMIVLRNLMSNAIKFSPRGSEISLKVYRQNQSIYLKVSDKGTGLKPDQIEKIKAGGSLQSTLGTSGEHGTGFGLGLSLNFMAKMGGHLEIESTYGVGSCFNTVLPAVP